MTLYLRFMLLKLIYLCDTFCVSWNAVYKLAECKLTRLQRAPLEMASLLCLQFCLFVWRFRYVRLFVRVWGGDGDELPDNCSHLWQFCLLSCPASFNKLRTVNTEHISVMTETSARLVWTFWRKDSYSYLPWFEPRIIHFVASHSTD